MLILTAVVFLFGHQFGLPAMAVAVPVSYIVQYVFLPGEEQILWKSDAEIWTEGFQNHQTLYTDVAYLLGKCIQ